jgi:hypothetical protein
LDAAVSSAESDRDLGLTGQLGGFDHVEDAFERVFVGDPHVEILRRPVAAEFEEQVLIVLID